MTTSDPTSRLSLDDEGDLIALELQRWPRNEYPLIGETTAESGVYELPAFLRRQAE